MTTESAPETAAPVARTDAQKAALIVQIKLSGMLGDQRMASMSGADKVDAERHWAARRVFSAVHEGESFESAFAREDLRWRAYAAEMVAKVNAAPKVKRGPMSGHSAISHRWVDVEVFARDRSHLEFMVARCLALA